MVVGEVVRLVGVGTMLGLIAAVGAASLMRRLLFGVQSWDTQTLITAASVLVASAFSPATLPHAVRRR